MTKKVVTCTLCPEGCKIYVEIEKEKIKVIGNTCKQGKEYAIQEVKDPRRILTTTIKIQDSTQKMLPVRSQKEIPKKLLKECVKKVSELKIKAPVKCGQIVCKNILDTGIDIVATRDMDKVIKK